MGDWQLLLGIAALVVALMALPTAFQMLWGRPRITFRFSRVVADDGLSVHLLAHLFNLPVTNKFLVWLGVKRDDAHFHAHVLVKDSQGNEVLSYSDPSQRSEPFKPVQHHLHSGPVPVTVETLGASKQNARIYYDNDAKLSMSSSQGAIA